MRQYFDRILGPRAVAISAIAAIALIVAAAPADAQWETSFVGVGETAGDDVHLLLGQISAHPGGTGWMPAASLQTYWVSYPGGSTWSITPKVGARYRASGGAFQVKVGYSFKNPSEDDTSEPTTPFFEGSNNGVSTSVQADYWGSGAYGLQYIASYNWGSDYLWNRGRAILRAAQGDFGSVHLGGEAVWQGELEAEPGRNGEKYRSTQVGPVMQWVTAGENILVLGAGWKKLNPTAPDFGTPDFQEEDTWYAKAEVVIGLGSIF